MMLLYRGIPLLSRVFRVIYRGFSLYKRVYIKACFYAHIPGDGGPCLDQIGPGPRPRLEGGPLCSLLFFVDLFFNAVLLSWFFR